MKLLTAIVLFSIFLVGYGYDLMSQNNYYQKVRIRKKVQYSETQKIGNKKITPLYFDFYEPNYNSAVYRPLVITLYGGGFVFGSRTNSDMRIFCKQLALNGYTAASIDYSNMRLCRFSNKNLIRAAYMSVQDLSTAIRFFKANAEDYNIDTSNIFLLGSSSGSATILHEIFMDDDESPIDAFDSLKFGKIHLKGDTTLFNYSTKVSGAILQWGCILDTTMIDQNELTNLCFIHCNKDKIVPYDSGYYFSCKKFPYVYGAKTISSCINKYDTGDYDCEIHNMVNRSHVFYYDVLYRFILNKKKFNECLQIILDFLENNVNR